MLGGGWRRRRGEAALRRFSFIPLILYRTMINFLIFEKKNNAYFLEIWIKNGNFEECLVLGTMIIYAPCILHF